MRTLAEAGLSRAMVAWWPAPRPRCPAVGKVRYESAAAAFASRDTQVACGAEAALWPFPCPRCEGWHLGRRNWAQRREQSRVAR